MSRNLNKKHNIGANPSPVSEPLSYDTSLTDGLLLETMLASSNDAIIFTDKNGIIVKISEAYTKFLNKTVEDCVGRPVEEIIENTRLPVVMKTGQAEIAQLHEINGKTMIATRIPLIVDGKVVGSFGRVMFKDIRELKVMHANLLELQDSLHLYKSKFETLSAARYGIDNIIGNSASITSLKHLLRQVAASRSNVLILGESGTGKELFAHAIHSLSPRSHMPLISINCASFPTELIESELFGYVGGSFTGSRREGKMGLFHAADNGTLFLDEIGDLPLHMQVKLLRAIQEEEIRRVGATESEKVNVRIIAATNKDLLDMVKHGTFRDDLYYRLNVVNLSIPPLRERMEDLSLIVDELILKISEKNEIIINGIDEAAMTKLREYNWPGNIRELENVLERSAIFLGPDRIIHGREIELNNVSEINACHSGSLKDYMANLEKSIIISTLNQNKGVKSATARALGLSRTSLYEKLEKYDLL